MPELGVERVEVTLRRLVADEIGDYLRRCADEGRRPPDEADQRQMARAIVRRELDVRARTALRLGEPQISEVEEDEITESVLAAAFSTAPAIDRLLERRDVTDLHVNGCDDVRLVTIDGVVERVDHDEWQPQRDGDAADARRRCAHSSRGE